MAYIPPDKLKYPIGKFIMPQDCGNELLAEWLTNIATLPARLEAAVEMLTPQQLDTPYRPGGWSIKQVVHHLADSHINSFIRTKLALTEDNPTIKPYYEDRFAELLDGTTNNITSSIDILKGIHARWIVLLKSLTAEQLRRTFIHPEQGRMISILECVGVYAWHGNHHLAQITELKQRENW
jgi:hypothetical protein